MQQKCNMTLIVFVYFTLLTRLCRALTMEGVFLQGDKEYLRTHDEDKAILECKFSLKEGETATAITWYHDEFMALKWGPPDPPQLGEGLNEGDAVLTRDDGNLEFAALRIGLEGKYRCEVMTSAGETYKSVNYQLLIVDMPAVDPVGKYNVDNCKISFSWDAPAVKPKPDIMCGVWSESHGYILNATKWMATPYYNGSVAYNLDEEVFAIFQMPLNSLIRCEMKITKVDDTHVLLVEKDYNITEVWERGCAPLEVGDGVHLEYDNERVTCHAEVKANDESAPVIAHVKCKDEFTPKYADFVSSVDLICKDTQWNIGGDLTWNHFDNLVCVETPKLPERPPTKKVASSQESSSDSSSDKSMEEDPSSGVNGLLTPWSLILLLGITLISGVIWGLRNNPKKKEERYMA